MSRVNPSGSYVRTNASGTENLCGADSILVFSCILCQGCMCLHTFVYFPHALCSTNPSPPKHLTVGLWSRSHLMYLQLILSHNRCHCNQSCHSTQGQPRLLPDISVTPRCRLLPLLSAPSSLDFINEFQLRLLSGRLTRPSYTTFVFYILLNNIALLCSPPH